MRRCAQCEYILLVGRHYLKSMRVINWPSSICVHANATFTQESRLKLKLIMLQVHLSEHLPNKESRLSVSGEKVHILWVR